MDSFGSSIVCQVEHRGAPAGVWSAPVAGPHAKTGRACKVDLAHGVERSPECWQQAAHACRVEMLDESALDVLRDRVEAVERLTDPDDPWNRQVRRRMGHHPLVFSKVFVERAEPGHVPLARVVEAERPGPLAVVDALERSDVAAQLLAQELGHALVVQIQR